MTTSDKATETRLLDMTAAIPVASLIFMVELSILMRLHRPDLSTELAARLRNLDNDLTRANPHSMAVIRDLANILEVKSGG